MPCKGLLEFSLATDFFVENYVSLTNNTYFYRLKIFEALIIRTDRPLDKHTEHLGRPDF
jgi:hypothetical protein